MDNKTRQRILRNDRKKLSQKRKRLAELRRQYQAAKTPASQASFRGKITRHEVAVASLEARIKRLSDG